MADRIRVLAYNVLDGCRKRREQLYDFLRQADADIVGIVEADGWHHYEPAIAANLGYPYCTTPRSFDEILFKHMALFSRLPIISQETVPLQKGLDGWHHGGLIADLDAEGKRLRVTLCHLKYNSEPTRIQELERLLPHVPGTNAVIMGDFNSFSPHGGYDAAYERRLEDFVRQHNGPRDYSYMLPRLQATRDTHDYGTIRRMLAHYQDAHPGTVSQWSTLPTGIDALEAQRPPEKIDYIFASKHLVLENPQVPKNSLTDIISDHYPVGVEIRTESLK